MARVCLTCFHDVNRHGELGCRALDNYSSCDCVAAPIDLIAAERDAMLAKFEALADEWERLATGNEASRGKPTRVAGYYRRHASRLRAVIKEARA